MSLNTELFFNILQIQSHSGECEDMIQFLMEYCSDKGWEIEHDEMFNLYITKGQSDTYPCVVAHMDTVHIITKGGIQVCRFVGSPNILFGLNPETMKQTGIGGDDKCGIYAALHVLENLEFGKAAFFVDEEIGCVGSRGSNIEWFKDCRFILQADRRGNNDFVTNICGPISSAQFQEAVLPIAKKFGYSFATGMMTDVQTLRDRKVGVSCVNVSAGYYNPHTASEYINLKDMEVVCNMFMEICEQLTVPYPFTYERTWEYYEGYEDWGGYFPRRSHWQAAPKVNQSRNSQGRFENARYQAWLAKRSILNDTEEDDHSECNPGPASPYALPYRRDGSEEEDNAEFSESMEEELGFYAEELDGVEGIDTKVKDIGAMTDAEWEEWERENMGGDEPPFNPLLKTKSTVF